MLTLVCYGCEAVERDCCGGAVIDECFSGLSIDDGVETTLIYSPLLLFPDVSGMASGVVVSDYRGSYYQIPVSGTSYADLDELYGYLKQCSCGEFIEYFDNFTGSVLQVTKNNGILPSEPAKVKVDINGQLIHGGGRDYTIDASAGQIIPVGWTFNNANCVVIWDV